MNLIQLIESKRATVGIIGMGYVGLPLARLFARQGFKVIGFDIDPKKVSALKKGRSYIKHIPASDIREMTRRFKFTATTDFSNLKKADAIIICVPTPLTEMKDPDLSFIIKTSETISAYLRKGQLVVLESTTYPGTTEEVVLPILQRRGARCGRDFYLAFSPEREDPGNPVYSTDKIPKVVGGINPKSTELARALYQTIVNRVVVVSSPAAAESTKLLENIYRCVNIALVNELKVLFNRMGINIWEVINAASTKPFGFQPFYPGPGMGGHCIPIDPFYLSWKARQFDIPTKFIELAGEINTQMPYYVVGRLAEALNKQDKSIKGAKVLILGVAYKKDVDDIRESPALKVIELLQQQGANVQYHDPYIHAFPKMRQHKLNLKSQPLTPALLTQQDAVVIITDHSTVDYARVVKYSRLVLDTRNATKAVTQYRSRIINA